MPKVTKTPELLLKENNELQAFLNDRKVPYDAKHNFTHTSIDCPRGSYNIPVKEMEIFNDLYYKKF